MLDDTRSYAAPLPGTPGIGAGGRRGPAGFGPFDPAGSFSGGWGPGGIFHGRSGAPGEYARPLPYYPGQSGPPYPDFGPPPRLPNDTSGGCEGSGMASAAAAAAGKAGGGIQAGAGKAAERSEGGAPCPPPSWGKTSPWGWSDWADPSGWADGPIGGFPGAGLFGGGIIGAERTIGSDQDMIEDLFGELGDSPEDVAAAKQANRASRGVARHRLKTLKAAAEHAAYTIIEIGKQGLYAALDLVGGAALGAAGSAIGGLKVVRSGAAAADALGLARRTKKLTQHLGEWKEEVRDLEGLDTKIRNIVGHSDEIRVGTFREQGDAVFYRQGEDLVVTHQDSGEFWTILKGGAGKNNRDGYPNGWWQKAKVKER